MTTIICKTCSKPFNHTQKGRGRPPVNCPGCKMGGGRVDIISLLDANPKPVVESTPKKTAIPDIGKFSVAMSNVGVVYRGDDEIEANKVFDRYADKSSQGYGKVGFETVVMHSDGVAVKEFIPEKELR